jgi:chromosome segregation ATPase
VSLNPKATQTLELRESQPIETRFALTNLTNDQIGLFLQQKSITPAVEAAFRKIVQQKSQVDSLDAEVSRRDEETQKIFDDQQRLRENLKALKGSPEERALTQRYTQQLADQETRLGTLRQESADLQTKSDKAQKDLNDLIQNLDLDATF